MSSTTEIYQQNQIFYQAYKSGKISKAEYDMVMAVQRQKLATALARSAQKTQYQPTAPPMSVYEAMHPPKTKAEAESRAFYRAVGQPQLARRYVAPTVPAGYEVQEAQEVVTPLPPQYGPTPKGGITAELQVTFKEKTYEVPTQLFGPKISYYDPKTGTLTEELTTREGKKIYVKVVPGLGVSPHEQQAILGLTLATTTATGVAVPKLGAFALGGVSVAEVGKVTITGEHLTVPEAISAAAVGELVGIGVMSGARAFQPRVKRGLEASYRQAVERGELWKPTAMQKVSMKVTGAQPPRLAQEIVGAGEPRAISFKMLEKGLTAPEESYFWDYPTPKSAQVYLRSPEPRVKAWAVGTLVKRVYLEGLFTTTVRTGLITETEKTVKPQMPYIPKEPYITKAVTTTPLPITFTGLKLMAIPQIKTMQITRQVSRQTLIQTSKQSTVLSQVLGTVQTQRQVQKQTQQQKQLLGLTQTQAQTQMQKQLLGIPTPTPTFTIPKTLGFPYYPLGGSEAGFPSFRRMWGRWFPRKHKVKTWEQQVKTFGLLGERGKVPKTLSGLGKAESFGDLGKVAGKITKGSRKTVKITKLIGNFGKTYNFKTSKRNSKKRRRKQKR